jgi:hypothetical protein
MGTTFLTSFSKTEMDWNDLDQNEIRFWVRSNTRDVSCTEYYIMHFFIFQEEMRLYYVCTNAHCAHRWTE